MPNHLIEGFTAEEIASLTQLDELVLIGKPIVFKIGKAEILSQFSMDGSVLICELGVAEGGGDGTLGTLIAAIETSARAKSLTAIVWNVYAVDCAKPNPKLKRVLEHLSFKQDTLENGAVVYKRRTSINQSLLRR